MSSPRNRSLVPQPADRERLAARLAEARRLGEGTGALDPADIADRVIQGDLHGILPRLPPASVDLLVADPPYNLAKTFGSSSFSRLADEDYEIFTASWLEPCIPLLKPEASVYVCCDWRGSLAVQRVLSRRLVIRNRITWEREKGRGSARNWKSVHEDIWFATVGESWHFDPGAVRLRRRVKAPYRDARGEPKDWTEAEDGRFRDTAPANLWTDITVPYWSMPENTAHPTQKPEKLAAKLILASSRPGDLVLDPFLGSGTTAVAAMKLSRRFIGIEIDPEHCLAALLRLEKAATDPRIQGYEDGVFWERNAAPGRR